jgi:hypothetical protein
MSMNSTKGDWEIHIYNQFHVGVELNFWGVKLHQHEAGSRDSLLLDLENFDHDKLELTGETLEDLVSQAVDFIKENRIN